MNQLSLEKNTAEAPSSPVFTFPASFAQRRLWFLSQLYSDTTAYHIPAMIRIRGPLDVPALHRSLQEIIRRHESLRTHFVTVDDEPQQVVDVETRLDLPIITLNVAASEMEEEAKKLAQAEAARPFDIYRGPLFRTTLLRLGDLDHILVLTVHHIISDGWSMAVLVREASVLYAAYSTGKSSPLPELPIQYADFSEWQREWLTGEVLAEQLAYWKRQLAGVEMLELPTDRPRPQTLTQEGATVTMTVSPELTRRLKDLCRREGVTLYTALLAAFQILLHRYSGQQDIAVGSPSAGRARPETEGLIGFFVNTLVMRANLSGDLSFREVLKQVQERILDAHAHQDVPFERIVDELQQDRTIGRTPLFQVMLALQNAPTAALELGPTRLEQFNFDLGTAKFELTLTLAEDRNGAGMRGWLEYNTNLFSEDAITRLAGHFQTLLASAVANPEFPIGELELLPEDERDELLALSNSAGLAYPRLCTHELFEEQVARTPELVAVKCEGQKLTYEGLNRRANQLAGHLKTLGAGPEVLVGICLERSLEMVVAILAVLKSGGAYVPMDPNYPPERVSYMLEDAQIKILITRDESLTKLPPANAIGAKLKVINLDQEVEAIALAPANNIDSGVIPLNAAYVIYTSGSTGKPKGVVVTHSNIVRLFTATWRWYEFGVKDVWTLFHSYAFDFSVWELWGALLYGGNLVVVPYWVSRSPEAFYELIKTEKVTVLNQTPSAFRQMSQYEEDAHCDPSELSLRFVIFGGEALEMSTLRPWFSRHGYERPLLINMYGITETTVHVTYQPVTEQIVQEDQSLIGGPIPDLQLYVLDPYMQPAPIGVAGELYVGGMGLARGYLNRPGLTAQRFVPHPFSSKPGKRLYRTGDAAKRRADGNVEYLGRTDQQVKIRGHRIELGEIEAALLDSGFVDHAVVVAREDEPGQKDLTAYVVARAGIESSQLREVLWQRLPEYMVPSVFVMVDTLPLTQNGKIDRRALLASKPERGAARENFYVAPRTPIEESLAGIWAGLLKVERVGIYDSFFELGGHSLLAVRLRTAIRKTFDRDIPLVTLFQKATVGQVAELLGQSPSESPHQTVVRIQPEGSGTPFFCVHPVGGNVLCYAALADEMGRDRPFYGLQSPVPDPQKENFLNIEQMASLYIEEVRKVQPDGPYLLGGWSMGGLVAFEMASQFLAAGDTVDLLAMIDTYPSSTARRVETPMLVRFAWDVGRLLGKDLRTMAQQFVALDPEEQWQMLLDTLVQEDVLHRETAASELRSMVDVFTQNSLAIESYSMRKIPQRVLLFRAAHAENAEVLAKEWAQWAGDGVELHLIPGDHYSIVQRPNVSPMAVLLKARVEQTVPQLQ
jgi:amino acid adenylation domain-containing protein